MGQDAYPDLHSKAAAIFHSLANNHAFVDGNKRTAVLAVILFYNLNGWQFVAGQDAVIDLALNTVVDKLGVPQIAVLLATMVLPAPPLEESP